MNGKYPGIDKGFIVEVFDRYLSLHGKGDEARALLCGIYPQLQPFERELNEDYKSVRLNEVFTENGEFVHMAHYLCFEFHRIVDGKIFQETEKEERNMDFRKLKEYEFVAEVSNGELRLSDVEEYCKTKSKTQIESIVEALEVEALATRWENVDVVLSDQTEEGAKMPISVHGTVSDPDIHFYRLMNACDLIRERFKIKVEEVGEIPKELQTDEAQGYFKKACELGLMTNNYEWLKGLQMLACFAREMSLKLNMGKCERISWKPFENLFNVPNGKLRLYFNDIQKTGQDPKEVYLIDKVFE